MSQAREPHFLRGNMIATTQYFTVLRSIAAAAVVAFGLGASGCVSDTAFLASQVSSAQNNPTPTPPSGPTPTPVVNPSAGFDNFAPPAIANNTKIDLVFIVDNSGSMGDNQTKLIASMNAFIDQFVMRGADWRISLLSTDVVSDGGHWTNCTLNQNNQKVGAFCDYISPMRGNWLTRYAGLPYLACNGAGVCNTSNVADAVAKFKANVALGTQGSGDERAIDSLMFATDAGHLAGANAGFFRADAYKAVIVISDENHGNLNGTDASSLALIQNAVDRMKSLGTGGYGFYFVNDLQATPAANTDGDGINQYPAFYRAMANATGSLQLDITNADWGNELVRVGEDIITAAQKEFKLSKVPIPSSIVVKINGVVVAQDAANGWQYHPAPQNSIELYGTAKTNAAGQALRVEYLY